MNDVFLMHIVLCSFLRGGLGSIGLSDAAAIPLLTRIGFVCDFFVCYYFPAVLDLQSWRCLTFPVRSSSDCFFCGELMGRWTRVDILFFVLFGVAFKVG